MSRTFPEVQRHPEDSPASQTIGASKVAGMRTSLKLSANVGWEFWAVRALFVVGTTALCFALEPFQLHGLSAAGRGFLLSFLILFMELRLRRATTPDLLGGALGAGLGLLAALPAAVILSHTDVGEPTKSF